MRRQIIAITGPTASGKSRLAIELAKEINGEIISADSRLIYKDFDIAVAKPSVEDLESVRHHLVNIIDPTYQYTVGNFVDEAKNCIQDIRSRGKIPIVTGGTGLYFRSLLQDYDIPRVEPDIELRNSLEKLSSDELYKLLIQKDEKTALKIHKNNQAYHNDLDRRNELNRPLFTDLKKKYEFAQNSELIDTELEHQLTYINNNQKKYQKNSKYQGIINSNLSRLLGQINQDGRKRVLALRKHLNDEDDIEREDRELEREEIYER